MACPTLLLSGDKGPRFLIDAADAVAAAIPGAARVVIPGAGHNGPDLEAPDAVAAALRGFFEAKRP